MSSGLASFWPAGLADRKSTPCVDELEHAVVEDCCVKVLVTPCSVPYFNFVSVIWLGISIICRRESNGLPD